MTVIRRPFYIEELVIHNTVNLSTPRPMLCSAALCCIYSLAFMLVLCRTIPWLQDKLSELIVTAVSFHLAPVITTPA